MRCKAISCDIFFRKSCKKSFFTATFLGGSIANVIIFEGGEKVMRRSA